MYLEQPNEPSPALLRHITAQREVLPISLHAPVRYHIVSRLCVENYRSLCEHVAKDGTDPWRCGGQCGRGVDRQRNFWCRTGKNRANNFTLHFSSDCWRCDTCGFKLIISLRDGSTFN